MSTATPETAIPSGISKLHPEIFATAATNPLTHVPTISYSGAGMSDETITTAADDFKARMKRIGWSQRDFADFMGFHFTTLTKWWQTGTPTYALRVLEMLEREYVPAAWKGGKTVAAPTGEDAMRALHLPVTATIDAAIKQGWSRADIAAGLRLLADSTDGGSKERE